MNAIDLPGLPRPGAWDIDPVDAQVADGVFTITAGPITDLFTDPMGTTLKDDAPRWSFPADARFTLSAHVSVEFASTFDAAVLVVRSDDQHWGKLCFEFSPQGEPMIVSVVTNGVSDDCNSVPMVRRDIFLRISRLDPAIAFHYSEDGLTWRMVRFFRLAGATKFSLGFTAQSPTGQGCTARFSDIRYTAQAIGDLRSGV